MKKMVFLLLLSSSFALANSQEDEDTEKKVGVEDIDLEELLDELPSSRSNIRLKNGRIEGKSLYRLYNQFKENAAKYLVAKNPGMKMGEAIEIVGRDIALIDKVFAKKFEKYLVALEREKDQMVKNRLVRNCFLVENREEWSAHYSCVQTEIVLQPEAPPEPEYWYQKWYFWVPVVAVVVGASAIAVGVKLSMDSDVHVKEYGGYSTYPRGLEMAPGGFRF